MLDPDDDRIDAEWLAAMDDYRSDEDDLDEDDLDEDSGELHMPERPG